PRCRMKPIRETSMRCCDLGVQQTPPSPVRGGSAAPLARPGWGSALPGPIGVKQLPPPTPSLPRQGGERRLLHRPPPVLLILLPVAAPAHAADDLAVDVVNASEPTLCAEKDNVTLNLISSQARRFVVEAVHPAYVGTIAVDRAAPDFGRCNMASDPVHAA